jgi:hypothetical protein
VSEKRTVSQTPSTEIHPKDDAVGEILQSSNQSIADFGLMISDPSTILLNSAIPPNPQSAMD